MMSSKPPKQPVQPELSLKPQPSSTALEQSSAAIISAACASSASHVAIEIVEQTGSTNADLLARIDTLAGPTLRIAHQQTAGRGRAGRSWLSEPGAALMFSLAWRFKGPLHRMSGLPMAVGVALAETLGSLGVPVQIKWPNDLLRDGAKLAGILVESQTAKRDTDGAIWAVIGVGLNLLMPDQLENRIGRSVAAAPWLAQMPREQLVATLLSRLAAVLAEFDDTGFAPFCERWNALHAWHGREVVILDHEQIVQQGRAAGVDAIGRLLLDTAAGRVEVLSGDVSLRLKPESAGAAAPHAMPPA